MWEEPRCQVSGCDQEGVVLLPAVPWTVCTFAQLATAPLHSYCARHEASVSDRYAAAADWTALHEATTARPADPAAVRRVCELLQGMRTPKAHTVHMALLHLLDTP